MDARYSFAPEIKGLVTASLRNVRFETALHLIVRQIDATYRIESNEFEFVRRGDLLPAQLFRALKDQRWIKTSYRRLNG